MTSVDAVELAGRVRRRFTVAGGAATRAAVGVAVRAETPVLAEPVLRQLADEVHEELVGAGPLAPLLEDPAVTDVLVNGVETWVDRGAGLVPAPVTFTSPQQVRRLAQRLAAACGRRLDDGCPYADARLPDGTRVHAVLPPIAVGGPYLSLRTFRRRPLTLPQLVAADCVTPAGAELLAGIVAARLAFLIVGGTGSGKTTLLASLLSQVPADERIVIVEDAAELRPEHPHVVALQARTANVEGAGAVGLRELIRQALRMRPDRLVVGECRGAEVVDLLGALNTGHDGGAGTLHANTPADVPARLEALGQLGGLPRPALHAQVAAALHVVIQVQRLGGHRQVQAVCLLRARSAGQPVEVVPAWDREHGAGPGAAALAQLMAVRGVEAPVALLWP